MFEEFLVDSRATYESEPHRSLAEWVQSQPAMDWLIATYQDTSFSARKIGPFISATPRRASRGSFGSASRLHTACELRRAFIR
ncbi:hypothetical protein BRAS3843_1330007 [Bradyrhizobium sp. STM 3843]|nr:hypothetical protein BRAS3843_1330007 [Bradyrhizobium sp. STM 3843]